MAGGLAAYLLWVPSDGETHHGAAQQLLGFHGAGRVMPSPLLTLSAVHGRSSATLQQPVCRDAWDATGPP
jgi:hypothetical protein